MLKKQFKKIQVNPLSPKSFKNSFYDAGKFNSTSLMTSNLTVQLSGSPFLKERETAKEIAFSWEDNKKIT